MSSWTNPAECDSERVVVFEQLRERLQSFSLEEDNCMDFDCRDPNIPVDLQQSANDGDLFRYQGDRTIDVKTALAICPYKQKLETKTDVILAIMRCVYELKKCTRAELKAYLRLTYELGHTVEEKRDRYVNETVGDKPDLHMRIEHHGPLECDSRSDAILVHTPPASPGPPMP